MLGDIYRVEYFLIAVQQFDGQRRQQLIYASEENPFDDTLRYYMTSDVYLRCDCCRVKGDASNKPGEWHVKKDGLSLMQLRFFAGHKTKLRRLPVGCVRSLRHDSGSKNPALWGIHGAF